MVPNLSTRQERKEQNLRGAVLDDQDDVAYQTITLVEVVNYREAAIAEGSKNANFSLILSDEMELREMFLLKAGMGRSSVARLSLV